GDRGGYVRAMDEAGEEQWTWEFDGQFEGDQMYVRSVVSLDPLVVTADANDDYEQETLLRADEEDMDGFAFAFDYDPERYVSPCGSATLSDCGLAVTLDGYLYLASFTGRENTVVAFDMATGSA